VQRNLLLCGIGGQGVQLIAKTLALAALQDGQRAMLASEFGGEMRGGLSLASVCLGDDALRALPVVPTAHVALVVHSRYWSEISGRLDPDASVVADEASWSRAVDQPGQLVLVDATTTAREIGAPQSAGFVLLGALVQLLGLVRRESLNSAAEQALPAHRRKHAPSNLRAIAAGAQAVRGRAA
jgi:2-oxoglutarate ferredoxin oxidoreductase subunit gamma